MYKSFRSFCERLLRIPPEPGPPPGDGATTRVFTAAPNYYKYLLFVWALRSGGSLAIVTIALGAPLTGAGLALADNGHYWAWILPGLAVIVLGMVGLASLFLLAALRLDFEKRWYLVTDRSLRIREGVVIVREMTVNFVNIQNISISQGPIQRWLGLSDLRVDTAGGGGGGGPHHQRHGVVDLHTAWFRGIDNASQVRELIQERLRLSKDAGLGDPDDVTHAHVPSAIFGRRELSPAVPVLLREMLAEARGIRVALDR